MRHLVQIMDACSARKAPQAPTSPGPHGRSRPKPTDARHLSHITLLCRLPQARFKNSLLLGSRVNDFIALNIVDHAVQFYHMCPQVIFRVSSVAGGDGRAERSKRFVSPIFRIARAAKRGSLRPVQHRRLPRRESRCRGGPYRSADPIPPIRRGRGPALGLIALAGRLGTSSGRAADLPEQRPSGRHAGWMRLGPPCLELWLAEAAGSGLRGVVLDPGRGDAVGSEARLTIRTGRSAAMEACHGRLKSPARPRPRVIG